MTYDEAVDFIIAYSHNNEAWQDKNKERMQLAIRVLKDKGETLKAIDRMLFPEEE